MHCILRAGGAKGCHRLVIHSITSDDEGEDRHIGPEWTDWIITL